MSLFRPRADDIIEERPDLFEESAVRRPRKQRATRPESPARSRTKAASPGKSRLLRLLAWTGIVLLTLPLAGIGAGVGALASWLEDAPPIREFDEYNPPEATLILDKEGRNVTALFEQRRFVVSVSELPPDLVLGFVAIEDHRFYEHFGIDFFGVARAATLNAVRGGMSQGASTITQQTARNLLPRVGREKTVERKLREMLVALQMEHRYTKTQILEVYLNQIYLGSGTYGVEAASRTYFGKPAGELELEECAALAGLPQLPERFSPLNNPDLTRNRRDLVLARMWELGLISDSQYDAAITSELVINPERIASSDAPYFVDAVRREIANDARLGGTKLQTAGWRIQTTLDPALQEMAEEVVRLGLEDEEKQWIAGRQERYRLAEKEADFARFPATGQVRMASVVRLYKSSIVVELPGGWRSDVKIPEGSASYFVEGDSLNIGDGVDIVVGHVPLDRGGLFQATLLPERRLQGALVCIDTATGEVRALVGGRDFTDRANGGYFNRAVQGHRQAGSTMKPFFFAAALERGLTPYTTFYDQQISFADGYTPRNFENQFFGVTSLQTALEHSRNVSTILMTQEIGIDYALGFVRDFQRTGATPWELPREWPVVLGTTPVTPLELAAAYQPIANGGLARGPFLVKRVWNEEDRETAGTAPARPEQLLTSQTDAYMVQMMMGVMGHGTGKSLLERLPESLRDRIAGKSGTTNDNRDAWFAGFTPYEVAVVWVGFDQYLPLAPGRTGSRAAGPIWAEFLAQAWEMKTEQQQSAPMPLPADYVLVAVNPKTSEILIPGASNWIEPPVWRVLTTDEYEARLPRLEAAESESVPAVDVDYGVMTAEAH